MTQIGQKWHDLWIQFSYFKSWDKQMLKNAYNPLFQLLLYKIFFKLLLTGYNQIASHANPKLEPSEGIVIVGSISCDTRMETFKSSKTHKYKILKRNAKNSIYSHFCLISRSYLVSGPKSSWSRVRHFCIAARAWASSSSTLKHF